jgi:hypothetical protein
VTNRRLGSGGSVQDPEAESYEFGNKFPVFRKILTRGPPDITLRHQCHDLRKLTAWCGPQQCSGILPVYMMKAGTTQYRPPTANVPKKKSYHISPSSYARTEAHLTHDIDFTSNTPPPQPSVTLLTLSLATTQHRSIGSGQQRPPGPHGFYKWTSIYRPSFILPCTNGTDRYIEFQVEKKGEKKTELCFENYVHVYIPRSV